MPQYVFFCTRCTLQFKRRLAMGVHPTHLCPECRGVAPRQWEGQGFGFEFEATPGTAQANSGVSKHDYPTADQAVGRSAEAQWGIIHARNAAKSKIRDNGVGLSRRDQVENGQVVSEYAALPKGTYDARKKLEGVFKTKAERDGIESPLSNVSTSTMKKVS
jgi:putative FmdB family regulatory protein